MQQALPKLRISEFFSVASQLAFKAAHIIKDVMDSKDLQKQMKDIDDPMTIADIKAQSYIIKGLRQFWPTIRIIGEEQIEFQGDLDFKELNPALYPDALFAKSRSNLDISTEIEINDNVVVWVDPLDGTLSYVNNEFDAVTTLIGLSVGQDPVLGVIGLPYPGLKNAQGEFIFKPKVFFGNAPQRRIFYSFEEDVLSHKIMPYIPYELVKPKPDNSTLRVCTSKNRVKQENLDLIQGLNPTEVIKIGGSGKKTLMILEGQADLYIYIGNKTKRWDICPGDALIRCFDVTAFDIFKKGVLVGFDGQRYDYDPKVSEGGEDPYANNNGLLVTLHGGEVLHKLQNQTKGFL